MAEPTKEELLARIAELEKQTTGRKKGAIEFRVGEKGGVSVYGSAASRSRSITSSGCASSMPPMICALSSRKTSTASSSRISRNNWRG